MTRPSVIVEAAFGVAPLSTPGSWTDITAYARGVSIRRGRAHELARPQAGECTIRLRNTDRRFDPTNTSGPYYGNLKPMTRVRVRAVHNSITHDLFTGYVEDWGQAYLPRPIKDTGDVEATVKAVDAFKVLGLYDAQSYSAEVLADVPDGYWRLRETSGTTAAQQGTVSAAVGTYTGGVTLGAGGPLVGGSSAASFDGSNDYVSLASAASLAPVGDYTVEAWVYPTATPAFGAGILALCIAGGADGQLALDSSRTVKSTNELKDGSIVDRTSSTVLALNTWTHVGIACRSRRLELYVNGAYVEQIGSELHTSVKCSGSAAQIAAGMFGVSFFEGRVAHAAVYDYALQPRRIAAHYAAGFDTFVGAPSGTQIGLLLDVLGWPSGERQLDVGSSAAQEFTPSGNLLELAHWLADSELGLMYVKGDGKVCFRERQDFEKLVTTSGTWGDDAGELPYADLVPRYDDADLYTTVAIAREGGGRAIATDAASDSAYGPRILERTGLALAADVECQSQADWLLSRYKDPALRFETLAIHAGADDARIPQLVGRDLLDRITVKRRPPGGGSVMTQECVIEQVDLQIARGGTSWTGTWSLAPWAPTYWIVGNPTYGVLGTTTRLGY